MLISYSLFFRVRLWIVGKIFLQVNVSLCVKETTHSSHYTYSPLSLFEFTHSLYALTLLNYTLTPLTKCTNLFKGRPHTFPSRSKSTHINQERPGKDNPCTNIARQHINRDSQESFSDENILFEVFGIEDNSN